MIYQLSNSLEYLLVLAKTVLHELQADDSRSDIWGSSNPHGFQRHLSHISNYRKSRSDIRAKDVVSRGSHLSCRFHHDISIVRLYMPKHRKERIDGNDNQR